jgi:hypothetical protein
MAVKMIFDITLPSNSEILSQRKVKGYIIMGAISIINTSAIANCNA